MRKLFTAVALLCLFAEPALAHRLDEYLQAIIFSIEPGTVQATMRLVPGVAVATRVLAAIDRNGDGVLSTEEQHRYAEQVLADLRMEEDGRALPLHLVAAAFPSVEEMMRGTGEIELSFSADLAFTHGRHELTFQNRHLSGFSVYLVNSLVPSDRTLQLEAQDRNQNQSIYRVTFSQGRKAGAPPRGFSWSGFDAAFHLGIRHIAEGTDHLLFLLTLLLPAPLLAIGSRWAARTTVRGSLLRILRIVTAFTLGHSLTLALAGFGILRLPSRPVEVLIAVSILVSAVHAISPLFPGREAWIAAAFGLIHGLAFASALDSLGVTGWYRLVSLLGFNIGIEAMQLAVVAATLPALLLLSRTNCYRTFRFGGAAFAIVASTAWIVERVTDRPNNVAAAIEKVAQHGLILAAALWGCAALAWTIQEATPVFARGTAP